MRRTISACAALVLVMLTSACASDGDETPSASANASVSASPASSVWSASSASDVALVDEILAIWNDNDVDAVADVYTADARIIVPDAPEQGMDGVREIEEAVGVVGNTYERIGEVHTAIEPPGGLASLPEGSRFLFFPMIVHSDVFDVAVEVNRDGMVETKWVFMPTRSGAFA